MHRLDTSGTQICFKAQIEIRGIHPNEHIRAILEQALSQLLADAEQLAQPAQHFHAIAVYG